MEKEYVTINGVPTKVLTWGQTLKASTTTSSFVEIPEKQYIICIPGNPGITEFYIEFLNEIYNKTNSIVWIIGHAGHEIDDLIGIPPPKENAELYSLQAQVKHKISFIESYVPNDAKITLIGHSIGCYMILKLLQVPSIHSKIIKSYLLFPTIEYMAETKNGKFFTMITKYFMFLLLPLVSLFNIFPLVIQNILIYIFCKLNSMPHQYANIIQNFLKPYSVYNSVTMASEEMSQVRERDNEILKNNVNSIKLYYGAKDDWAPINYYVNIRNDIPNIDAEVCDRGFAHAFVLQSSKLMADVIVNWIELQKHKSKRKWIRIDYV